MIVRLLPDQIAKHWFVIKFALQKSLPPMVDETPEDVNNILKSLLEESMQCWASVQIKEDNTFIEGIVITTVVFDSPSKSKNLLVYCVYSFANISNERSWMEGIEKLVSYAHGRGCNKIMAFTNEKNIIKLILRLGGSMSAFITLPVEVVYEDN